jgi:hypothetical protein
MFRVGMSALALASLVLTASAQSSPELQRPFKVLCGDEPIDTDIGHAAPFVGDLDGDGLLDLLVGQFGQGQLRIYKNAGSKGKPKFDGFKLLTAGGTTGTVPSG